MAPSREDDRLRRILALALKTIDDEDAEAELEELKNRKFTLADIRAAVDEAPEEERREFYQRVYDGIGESVPEPEEPEEELPPPEPAPEPVPEPVAQKKTRPGRKSGMLYGFDVDPETQQIRRLDIPAVYSGEDEPDEVEYDVA